MLRIKLSLASAIAAGLMLGGCIDSFSTFVVFPHAQFVTIADVDLRSGQDAETSVVAHLPKGTVVNPLGQSGSECNSCMRVDTPQGSGWLYTRYLATLPPVD